MSYPDTPGSCKIVSFPRIPVRAYVLVPDDDPKRDQAQVKRGGYAFDDGALLTRGQLDVLKLHLRSQVEARGLPITVHPECERRAAL